MINKFTRMAQEALQCAQKSASEMGHTYIGSEHLLLGLALCHESIASKLLLERGAVPEKIKSVIIDLSGEGVPSSLSSADLTPRAQKIIQSSAYGSSKNSREYIGTEHLLLSILEEDGCVAVRILENLDIPIDDLQRAAHSYLFASEDADFLSDGQLHQTTASRKATESGISNVSGAPTISQYGRDLTSLAEYGKIDPVIGRVSETERVIQILLRRSKNNPCLIGEPGVGKTAVVEGLAQRIADGNVPESLRNKRIVTLDIPSMIAGAKYRGEFEERLKNVMSEAVKRPDIIIFIDEIHTIIGAGAAEGAVDAANIIKPALARGELHVIGATTTAEYRWHIEKDSALERRFQSVTIGEPNEDEAFEILRGLRPKYEAHHNMKISDDSLTAAISLSVRYIHDRFLPDKAIDLIDEAASRVRIRAYTSPPEIKQLEEDLAHITREKAEAIKAQNFERAATLRDQEKKLQSTFSERKNNWSQSQDNRYLTVTPEDIADTVTQWTSIPQGRLLEGENERLLNLEKDLNNQIIGQEEAVHIVSRAIQRGRTGLGNPDRPIGTFIFLGGSGVGKTQLSKALCYALFGDENAMIRFDMSEYMEKHSVSKLIGSPPGYVGYEEGGILTEQIRRRPYSVVLFDEIEKAHPDIQNILLQILDDGILNDSQGRRVYFKNAVIIMTSNLGAEERSHHITGFSNTDADRKSATKERMLKALKERFSPEFLNRIDEIIIFNPLTALELEKITSMFLEKITERAKQLDITVKFDHSVVSLIARSGIEANLGARPLQRAAVRLAEDSLTDMLLEHSIKAGDTVTAYAQDGKVIYKQSDK